MSRRVHLRRRPAGGLRRRHQGKTGVDRLVPEPPEPPRRGGGRPGEPFGYRIRTFGPYFLAVAAIVAVERVSMIVVVSERFSNTVRMGALAVFFGIVLTLIVVGGRWFGRQFAAARSAEV